MKIKIIGVFLALAICLLNVTLSFAATDTLSATQTADKSASTRAVRTAMKVCVEKMNYYKNASLTGAPLGTKKFGEIVYCESADEGVVCIYNKSGNMLGYCELFSLVSQDAKFFAEIPQKTNEARQISKLVDLRKYILIFGAKVNCDESEPILIQYDTAMKLFRAAKEINETFDCTLNVEKAYIQIANGCEKDHSTGAVLTLSITKRGESTSEKIPVYEDDMTLGKISKVLSDHSLIRTGETDCFYDADIESYIPTSLDMSSLTYSVWE